MSGSQVDDLLAVERHLSGRRDDDGFRPGRRGGFEGRLEVAEIADFQGLYGHSRRCPATSVSLYSKSGCKGFQRTPTREMAGAVSFRNCSRLAARSDETSVTPVMLPPGRARPPTSPACTGSRLTVTTTGMVVVTALIVGATSPPRA